MEAFFSLLRSFIYVPAFILFFGWIALQVRTFDKYIGLLPEWITLPGILLLIIGGMLALICVGVFITIGKGTPAVFDPPTEFVAVGPYKYVRNPMYIGGFNLFVGFGLYHKSVSVLILSVILFFLFHLFVVYVEEPQLKRRFEESYLQYKNSVRRWIPEVKLVKKNRG